MVDGVFVVQVFIFAGSLDVEHFNNSFEYRKLLIDAYLIEMGNVSKYYQQNASRCFFHLII